MRIDNLCKGGARERVSIKELEQTFAGSQVKSKAFDIAFVAFAAARIFCEEQF